MRSTHKLLAIAALALVCVGCVKSYQPVTDKISPSPILDDPAMDLRHWERNSALYANGTSVSLPTLFPFVPKTDNVPQYTTLFSDPGLFYGQAAVCPVTMFVTPPFQPTVYRGVYTPPTYTAVPVVPSDAQVLQFPPLTSPRRTNQ